MSLMGTLAKVAVGVLIAKSVGGMMKGGRAAPQGGTGGGFGTGTDGRFGGPASPGRRTTGLEDMMGDVLGGAKPAGRGKEPDFQPRRAPVDDNPFGQDNGPVVAGEPGRGGGGLGDLLEQIGGMTRGGSAQAGGPGGGLGGSLNDVLGKLGGSGSGSGGGLGDLLGSILGGAAAGTAAGSATKGFGETLNDAFNNGGEPSVQPSRDQEAAAALLLKAMIQAAKSDGRIDQAEQKRLMENLGQATPEEMAFVKRELAAPIDIRGLCAQVPEGLQAQVYMMSLMAIDLDNRTEGQYLISLAQGLGLSRDQMAAIHTHVGAPSLTG